MKKLLPLIFFLASSFLHAQKYLPPDGQTLLIIGQDLESISGYVDDGDFPTPGGTTAYISLYDCANPDAYFPFGGLGEHLDGTAAPDIDWGSGPLNAHNCAFGFPNSTLAIGLYMTEEFFPNGLNLIASGSYDAEIKRLADFIASTQIPVYLRIGYEFDGKWNIGYENSSNFKSAYKHIVDVIRPIAPNCEMVLQACTSPVDDILEGYHENIEDWYPGDEYVDWLGYSWFLNRQEQFDLTDEVIALARKQGKPVMVCESAPQGYDIANLQRKNINTMLDGVSGTGAVAKTPQEIWDEWYEPYFTYIHDHADVVRAVAYINCNWDAQAKWADPYNEGYWGDTRVQANETIKQLWLGEIESDFWLHGSDSLFSLLGKTTPVKENKAPIITFAEPVQNSFPFGTDVRVKLTVTDDDTVNQVSLFVDNQLFGTLSAGPYSWNVSGLSVGTHVIEAQASDNYNNIGKKSISLNMKDTSATDVFDGFIPEDGKTLFMIGQTYTQEYKDYVNAMGIAPAGSSHYAELYKGEINQGDDSNNEAFLDYMEQTYPGAFAELAISIKDNPAAGGYTGPNAGWKACVDIVAGAWDDEIDAIAQSMKARNLKFLLRIGYEVSLMAFANKTETEFIAILDKYNSQGINPLENASQVEEFDLAAYKNAYNYIANRIRNENQVSNVNFVYHPVRGVNDALNLYPGDDYVDWFGLSFFNHDVCWPTWEGATPPFENCPEAQEADANLAQCLDWAKDEIQKPIIIAESAAQSHTSEQTDAAHKQGYLQKVYALIEKYNIKAWVYINSNWVAKGWNDVWGDSRLESDALVKQSFLSEITKERYIHYSFSEVKTQFVSLKAGWNLVSVYLDPTDNSVASVFPNALIVKNDDLFYNQHQPAYLNSLKKITPAKGYMLYNMVDETVQVNGSPATADAHTFIAGWQLYGVSARESKTVDDVFTSDLQNIRLIKDFDGYWQPDGTENTLNEIKPGKAYFILY